MNAPRFAVVPTRAIMDPDLNHATLRVLCALGTFADQTGLAWPSYATLAERCGIDRRAVMRHVEALVRMGYLALQKRANKSSGHQSNKYLVKLDFPADPSGNEDHHVEQGSGTESHQVVVLRATQNTSLNNPLDSSPSPTSESRHESPSSDPPMPRLASGRAVARAASPSVDDKNFEAWWACWDRAGTKRGKGHAKRAYRRAIGSGADHGQLCRAVTAYMRWTEARGDEPDKIKHPATWLNAECWLDELPNPHRRTMDHAPRRESQLDRFKREADERATARINGSGWPGGSAEHALSAFAGPGGHWDDAADL